LEQFDLLHRRGSSHGESRIIRPTYPQDYYTRMMKQAYVLWEAAQQEAGLSVYTQTGGLDFAPTGTEGLRTLIEGCVKEGLEHEVLTPEQLSKRYPLVQLPEGYTAVLNPQAGMVHATKAVSMFLQLARSNGATIRDQTKVLDIIQNGQDGGVQVLTDAGPVRCDKCVITVGAWAGKMIKKTAGFDVPLKPIHTTVGYFEVEDLKQWSSDNFPVFIRYDKSLGVYGCPSRDYPGLIKVALHDGPPCDPDNRSLRPGIEELNSGITPFIQKYLRGVNSKPAIAEACMYTMTPDEDFVLDMLPNSSNIAIGAGFSGHGFKFGPLIGKILSDLVIHGKCLDVDLSPFTLARFKSKSVH